MNPTAVLFLVASWTIVLSVTAWSYWRILRPKDRPGR